MTTTIATCADNAVRDARTVASDWLYAFERALARRNPLAVAALFQPVAYWRDHLGFAWDLRTLRGPSEIAGMLALRLEPTGAHDFRLDTPVPKLQTTGQGTYIEAVFRFETRVGRGRGVVRLRANHTSPDGWTAWVLFTTLNELIGYEELSGPRRPRGGVPGERADRLTWARIRERERAFVDNDPRVLIVGGGHSGLMMAARLRQLGVGALVVEAHDRVGDNWRARYRSLALHSPVHYDHLPYLPFPATWPLYTPRDKLADWLESYVDAMDLNVWTSARLTGGTYDQREGRWSVSITRSGATPRTLHPTHVVLATGANGRPRLPHLPGRERFTAQVLHSSQFSDGEQWAGRKVVVIGAGNSAHDIVQELHECGAASTTMVQRSSTYVVSRASLTTAIGRLFYEGGPPAEEGDFLAASWPYAVRAQGMAQAETAELARADRPLLDALRAAGFRLNFGVRDGGIPLTLPVRGGGYYLNIGASDLIAEGRVRVVHGDLREFTETGIELVDGERLDADLVVLATGFATVRETARELFGDAIADRCAPVLGLDEENEPRGLWRPSGQDGLWFAAGNLNSSRYHSRLLALQIKAIEEGLVQGDS